MKVGNEASPFGQNAPRDATWSRASRPPIEAHVRRVVSAAALGTVIEYFDFSVYAFLVTTLAGQFFPAGNPTGALLYTLGVFGAAFVLRPVGGILIGHLGDRYGRKRALVTSVVGMALASTVIGVLPTYATIGLAAPALLLVMRCIQGLSAGGELGGAASYVAEVSPDDKRGFLTSTTQIGTLAGTMLGALTVALLHLVLNRTQFVEWGWRIPFLLSLPLGVVALKVRMHVSESRQFDELERRGAVARVPALQALGSHPRGVATVCGLSLVSFASYYLVFTFMATYFEQQHIMSAAAASWSTSLTLLLAALAIPWWGRVTDRVGRRPLLIGVCVSNLLLAYPLFFLMSVSPIAASLSQILLGQLEAVYLAVILATYCEQFPATVRASGFSLGYNFASIFAGGTAPYIATWLIASTGRPSAPAAMLMVTAAISLCTALTTRETAHRPLPIDENHPA